MKRVTQGGTYTSVCQLDKRCFTPRSIAIAFAAVRHLGNNVTVYMLILVYSTIEVDRVGDLVTIARHHGPWTAAVRSCSKMISILAVMRYFDARR